MVKISPGRHKATHICWRKKKITFRSQLHFLPKIIFAQDLYNVPSNGQESLQKCLTKTNYKNNILTESTHLVYTDRTLYKRKMLEVWKKWLNFVLKCWKYECTILFNSIEATMLVAGFNDQSLNQKEDLLHFLKAMVLWKISFDPFKHF